MDIIVNNKQYSLPEGTNVLKFLELQSLSDKGLAVAINNQIIPRTSWIETMLSENDKITIIRATQGG
jgi:sulfur carrier protein